jgi:hypothetical protein
LSHPISILKTGRSRQQKMDDISFRNHVDSLRFRGDIARTKWLILFEKHATANSSANGK